MENLRIDKWLWMVRIFKTRTLSTDFCKSGKIRLNNQNIKPSHDLKIGDTIEIQLGQLLKTVKVIGFPKNRISAKLVKEYLEDLTPKEVYERYIMMQKFKFIIRDRGTGRPTKKERRDMESFDF